MSKESPLRTPSIQRNKISVALGVLQTFVAMMALPAGILLLIDSSGESLGISSDYLQSSPFSDFFIPGLFLLVGNGIGHLIGAVLSFRKKDLTRVLGIGLGVFLLLWIVIQVYYIGMIHFLQPMFFIVAIAEIILSSLLQKEHRI